MPFSKKRPASSSPSNTILRVVFLVMTVLSSGVRGFSTGGPAFSCRNLIPGHSNGTQPGPPPYRLSVSDVIVQPGSSTTITLESRSDFPFKGFLCAVSERDDSDNNSVGRMALLPGTTASIAPVTCSRSTPDTGMTHASKEDKFRVQFDWIAPSTGASGRQYKLRCACVMSFSRCWTDLRVDLVVGTPPSALFGSGRDAGDNSRNIRASPVSGNNPPSLNRGPFQAGNNRAKNVDAGNRASNMPLLRGPENSFSSWGSSSTSTGSQDTLPASLNPSLFGDNSIGLPLDPAMLLALSAYPLSENSVSQGGSNFVLAPGVVQTPNGFLDLSSLASQLNQIGGGFNSVGQSGSGGVHIPVLFLPTPASSNNINSFNPTNDIGRPVANRPNLSTQNFLNEGPPGTNFRGATRNSDRAIGRGSSPGHVNQAVTSARGSRMPSDSGLLREPELFVDRRGTSGTRDGDFSLPTGFFITPDALLRFRLRNSLLS